MLYTKNGAEYTKLSLSEGSLFIKYDNKINVANVDSIFRLTSGRSFKITKRESVNEVKSIIESLDGATITVKDSTKIELKLSDGTTTTTPGASVSPIINKEPKIESFEFYKKDNERRFFSLENEERISLADTIEFGVRGKHSCNKLELKVLKDDSEILSVEITNPDFSNIIDLEAGRYNATARCLDTGSTNEVKAIVLAVIE